MNVERLTSEDQQVLSKLRDLYAKGLIPSASFLERAESVGKAAAARRATLKHLAKAVNSLPLQVRFSDYFESLANATGLEMSDAIFAIGCDGLQIGQLDSPKPKTLRGAQLLGLEKEVIKGMMLAAHFTEELEWTLAGKRGESKERFPHDEVARKVEELKRVGSESVKRSLIECERQLDAFFNTSG